MCSVADFVSIIVTLNEAMKENTVQIYVYEESQKQDVVRVFENTTRARKYSKNFVSFANRVLKTDVTTKDIHPIYLYLRKVVDQARS